MEKRANSTVTTTNVDGELEWTGKLNGGFGSVETNGER